MDARSYSGFLLLMEQTLSTVSILRVGAQELQCESVSSSLRSAEQCLIHAVASLRDYVPPAGNPITCDNPKGAIAFAFDNLP